MTDREFVESMWDTPRAERLYRDSMHMDSEEWPDEWRVYNNDNATLSRVWGNRSKAWQAAAEYTRTRLEEIRQLEVEIGQVAMAASKDESLIRGRIWARIQTRLESLLADLRRGMKEAK